MVANVIIAALFFKEKMRFRDQVGCVFITIGVGFIIGFAPKNSTPLTGRYLEELLVQPGAIVIYVVYVLAIIGLRIVVHKIGHDSVLWYILLSSLIGSFSTMAARPVATFLLQSLRGLASDTYESQLKLELTQEECARSNGFGDGTRWLVRASRVVSQSTAPFTRPAHA